MQFMLSTWFSRWTLWLFLFPRLFLDPHPRWERTNVEQWSETTYEWSEDPWQGRADYARNPWRTYMTGEGDCEDYALVVLNMLYETTGRPLYLGFAGKGALPKHVVVYDGKNVYSSGRVYHDVDLDTYLDYSAYDWMVERRVR